MASEMLLLKFEVDTSAVCLFKNGFKEVHGDGFKIYFKLEFGLEEKKTFTNQKRKSFFIPSMYAEIYAELFLKECSPSHKREPIVSISGCKQGNTTG